MKLKLRISKKMTASRDSSLRMSQQSLKQHKVELGDSIKIGSSLYKVERIHYTDYCECPDVVWVSATTYGKAIYGEHRVSLGCDPEFIFSNTLGTACRADSWLPVDGQIGSDGPVAELRPFPGYHEDEVVEELRRLIRLLPDKVKKKFYGLPLLVPEGHSEKQNCAMGFHIHLGAPKVLTSFAAPETRDTISYFAGLLDYFVGIPAMLLEDNSTRRLGNGRYGKPGDWRISAYSTIEYRTPGGFHLRHPDYARGILGLALCIGKDALKEMETLTQGWRGPLGDEGKEALRRRYNTPHLKDTRRALLSPSKILGVNQLPNIIKTLAGLPVFEEHQKSIYRYFSLIKDNKQYNPYLLKNW